MQWRGAKVVQSAPIEVPPDPEPIIVPTFPIPGPIVPSQPGPGPTINLPPIPTPPPPNELDPGGSPPAKKTSGPYIVAICINDDDLSSDCLEKSATDASKRLATMILEEYLKSRRDGILKVVFPAGASFKERFDTLHDIETRAIAIVEAQLKYDVQNLEPFIWDSPAEKQQKIDIIQNNADNARKEADTGKNWNYEVDHSSHTFRTGAAYQQLTHILIHDW